MSYILYDVKTSSAKSIVHSIIGKLIIIRYLLKSVFDLICHLTVNVHKTKHAHSLLGKLIIVRYLLKNVFDLMSFYCKRT